MGRLDRLRAELLGWPDRNVAGLCERILSFMDSLPDSQLEMLTLNKMLKAIEYPRIDAEFIDALAVLANSQVHALDAKGMFVDCDEEEIEISGDDIIQARDTGCFIHPRTGDLVKDFERRIFPFYAASEKFRKLR